jgi:hypothetical protein
MEEWVTIILTWWLVPLTLFCFWLRYTLCRDWLGTGLQIGLIVISTTAGFHFYHSHAATLKGLNLQPFRLRKPFRDRGVYLLLAFILSIILIIGLSHGTINGSRQIDSDGAVNYTLTARIFKSLNYDIFADFREKDVSMRPSNYWLIDSACRDSSVMPAKLAAADLRYADAARAFLLNADLRNSNLMGAMLWGANLKGANLYEADLRGADLRATSLREANFLAARLQGADLRFSEGLTQEQLNDACGDSLTLLPPGLTIKTCPEHGR